jgi:DNA polymerase I-like protein with 3'-5' exonuclease and polymerase domains
MREDTAGFFWDDTPPETSSTKIMPQRTPPPIPDTGWVIPHTLPDLSDARFISIDTETHDPGLERKQGPDPWEGFIAGLAVGTDDGRRWYFPIRHMQGPNFPPEMIFDWAKVELGRTSQLKVGMNLVYDLQFLNIEGVDVKGDMFDVSLAEPLLDEWKRRYSLDSIAKTHLGSDEGKVDELVYDWGSKAFGGPATRKAQAGNLWKMPSQIVGPYAEGDVDLPLRIMKVQEEKLKRDNLWELCKVENSLLPMLAAMRLHGVRVNAGAAEKLGETLNRRLEEAENELVKLAGRKINFNAADDIAPVLDKLGIEYPLTEKTKKPSITKPYLKGLKHPVAKLIRNCRKFDKFRGTFIDGYLTDYVREGRIHTQFNQLKSDDAGARPGRFSSSNPNLQNIPVRDKELGPLLRSFFLPEEGEEWVRHDYSQIEYRLLVHYAEGEAAEIAQQKYRDDPETDYHQMVADLTGLDRASEAKNFNFGKIYGMGKATMMEQYGWTSKRADEITAIYYEKIPYAKPMMEKAAKVAENRGYIRTILGRRSRFPFWEPKERPPNGGRWAPLLIYQAKEQWPGKRLKRAFGYTSLNKLLQGSAADILKKAMSNLWKSGVYNVIRPMLLTVHDEKNHSVPRTKEGQEAVQEIKHIMETAVKLKIPLIADEERGNNWAEAK